MDTPWPLARHDARLSGQSTVDTTGNEGMTAWTYDIGRSVTGPPVITSEGNIAITTNDGSLFLLGPDGEFKWQYEFGSVEATPPAVGVGDYIYYGTSSHLGNRLHKVSPDGKNEFTVDVSYKPKNAPTIGDDGSIYLGMKGLAGKVSDDGTFIWHIQTYGPRSSSIAIGSNGVIYYIVGSGRLGVSDADGEYDRSYQFDEELQWGPSVSQDGKVFVASNRTLYCTGNKGLVEWKHSFDHDVRNSPSAAHDGRVYIPVGSGIVALGPEGDKIWEYDADAVVGTSVTISAEGGLYFGTATDYKDNLLFSLNNDGTRKWTYKVNGKMNGSPAISRDGALYFTDESGTVYVTEGCHECQPDVPYPPKDITATRGDLSITVNWSEPDGIRNTQVLGYRVYREDPVNRKQLMAILPDAVLTYTDRSVVALTNYTYYITADNGGGEGPESKSVTVMAITSPSAPKNIRLSRDYGFFEMVWDDPDDDGGAQILNYSITRVMGTLWPHYTHAGYVDASTTYFKDELVNDTQSYWYRICAHNEGGAGCARSETVGPLGQPNTDTVYPTVNITFPITGEVLFDRNVTVTGTADDDRGVKMVTVGLDGENWSLANGTLTWDVEIELDHGRNRLYINVTDVSGNSKVKTMIILVEEPPPVNDGAPPPGGSVEDVTAIDPIQPLITLLTFLLAMTVLLMLASASRTR